METLKEEIEFINDVIGSDDPNYWDVQPFKDYLQKVSDLCTKIQYTSITKKYLIRLYDEMKIGFLVMFESEAEEAKRLTEKVHFELAESGVHSVLGSNTLWRLGSIQAKLEIIGVMANNHNLVNIKKAVNDAYNYTATLAESMQKI